MQLSVDGSIYFYKAVYNLEIRPFHAACVRYATAAFKLDALAIVLHVTRVE